jgi:nitrate/nitrite transporter NarK
MLFGSIRSIINNSKNNKELTDNIIEQLKVYKRKRGSSIYYFLVPIVIAVIIETIFWSIVATSFTNPIIIVYCAIVLLYSWYTIGLVHDTYQKEKIKKQYVPHVLGYTNTIMIIIYIISLLM